MDHCLFCHQLIHTDISWRNLFVADSSIPLCAACQARLEIIGESICRQCGRKTEQQTRCPDCENWQTTEPYAGLLQMNRSLFTYNSFMQEVMTKWKYRGDYILKQLFTPYINKRFPTLFPITDYTIVPVPLTQARFEERAFNQSQEIARMIANKNKKPIVPALSRYEQRSEKQSKRTKTERMATANPFFFKKMVETDVLLVDDIYTTGMTLHHAAAELKKAGVKQVYSFTLIR
ncbi:ComF family protein [Gracilibacillus timonensis]|uniref:ComF family protein n=1 Tax=Gracilibacillus timonensis TaxID=1816696 RepID=UPI000826343E|nr:ComF family protein [Gracilibacillus timonensis]